MQRRMKDKDNFMIEDEEMMSSCLTKETHHTAPRLALDEERNCRVGGRRTEYSENYNVHYGHVWSICQSEYIVMNAIHDQMDRVDRGRLVESGGARDDSPSWNLRSVKQGDTIRADGASPRGSRARGREGVREGVLQSATSTRPSRERERGRTQYQGVVSKVQKIGRH